MESCCQSWFLIMLAEMPKGISSHPSVARDSPSLPWRVLSSFSKLTAQKVFTVTIY